MAVDLLLPLWDTDLLEPVEADIAGMVVTMSATPSAKMLVELVQQS
jgi:hypothetical protein